jgi:hypothetical protein
MSDRRGADGFGTHGVLSRQVGTLGVLSRQVGIRGYFVGTAPAMCVVHGVLSGLVSTHGVPTLRHSACCSRRTRTCAHACAARRRADYVLGAANTNVCPAGSAKITDSTACITAAFARGKSYSATVPSTVFPSGCYLDSNQVYFNTNAGAAHPASQPLCTAGAPLTRRCADARVLRGARGRCV